MSRFVAVETPLASEEEFVSDPQMSDWDDFIVGTAYADVSGTLYVEQGYPDSEGVIHWDAATTEAVAADTGVGFSETIVAPKWRVRFVNGEDAQTEFRLYARPKSRGPRA